MFDAKSVKNDIVRWIKNYFIENGKDCIAVVGISGGKDSAVVAALCCEALGKSRVYGVLMPRGEQPDIDAAYTVVRHLDINYSVINIAKAVDETLNAIEKSGIKINEQVRVNTPARIRMTTLYAVAAAMNGRVSNNCNLSEDFVGYSTKFGDAAGDFSPISSLTVTEVKMIGKELSLPNKIIEKTPIDGLSGKSDEENLGFSYDLLDRYIRQGICDDNKIKDRIDKLNKQGLHKLKTIPYYKF